MQICRYPNPSFLCFDTDPAMSVLRVTRWSFGSRSSIHRAETFIIPNLRGQEHILEHLRGCQRISWHSSHRGNQHSGEHSSGHKVPEGRDSMGSSVEHGLFSGSLQQPVMQTPGSQKESLGVEAERLCNLCGCSWSTWLATEGNRWRVHVPRCSPCCPYPQEPCVQNCVCQNVGCPNDCCAS